MLKKTGNDTTESQNDKTGLLYYTQKSDPPKLLLTFQGTSQIQFSIIPIKDNFQSHVKESEAIVQ